MNDNPDGTDASSMYAPLPDTPSPARRRPLLITLVIVGALCCITGAIAAGGWWASQALLPEATATPSPTPVRVVDGQPPTGWSLAFDEKFDDNTNNWEPFDSNGSDGKISASVEDGALRWVMSSKSWMYWTNWPSIKGIYEDAYITVEAQVLDTRPNDEATYGILFRIANNDNYYAFLVKDSGSYAVEPQVSGDFTMLVDWQSTDLVRSHAVNTVGVLTSGPHLTFFINDQQVDEVDDEYQMSGRVGVVVYLSDAGQDATIVFDNLKVYTP